MNKVADKVVPKEIAPILPIASMFIPGLQGMGPLMRYGLPQLMTALGSAKRTGKINPMAQAMTALASYSRGPGPKSATGREDAFFTENVGAGGGDIGYGAGQVDPGLAEAAGMDASKALLDPASKLTFTEGMDPIQFAAENQDAFKAFDFVKPEGYNMFNQMGDMVRPMTRGIGDALNNPFSSMGNFGKAVALGTAPALMNEAVLASDRAKAEQEAQIAANQQAMTNRQNAISNLTGYYGQMGTDPTLVEHFNPWTWYNEGGRVGMWPGGILGDWFGTGDPEDMPASDNDPYRMSPEEESNWNEIKNFINYMNARDLKMDPSEVMDLSGVNLNEGVDRDLMQQRIEALLNPNAKGGRIKYAGGDMVGGLGSLHPMNPAPSAVAPGMPNNMQVDGRNGTFIPMGAQEKKDDVPAMLAKNEFVMTSDAVKGMGNGDVNAGAQKMYDLMNQLEANV